MIAQWVPALSLRSHPDYESPDYDEAQDEYFAPEGWYQCYAVNGELVDEPFWKIHECATYWMPLPAVPELAYSSVSA